MYRKAIAATALLLASASFEPAEAQGRRTAC